MTIVFDEIMERIVVVVLLEFVFGISGYLIQVPTSSPIEAQTIPDARVDIQKQITPLFENICEDSANPIINRLAQEFDVNLTVNFSDPNAVLNLQKLIANKGFLSKTEIFTEYNSDHIYELRIIYELLYNAKNYEQFYKVAAWGRQNLNCGVFINAIYMAIQQRLDTEKLFIPAPYELLPNYFITKNVILQGVYISAGQSLEDTENVLFEDNTYTIDVNFTSTFNDNSHHSKLAYFREDIGLNSYYFLKKLSQEPWLNTSFNGRYGEDVYQMMKQLMARYNLERYANNIPELENLNWNSTFDDQYDPKLIYANGNEFMHRTAPLELRDNEDVLLLTGIENSIETVVIHLRESGHNKTQILNHLMEILVTGDISYETLARRLLGKDLYDTGAPTVMEHFMTSLRDPAFWKINCKIVNMVDSALSLLPSYTKNELFFPGIEIVNIDVKKMVTEFDYYNFDVTDALKVNENSSVEVKIGQPRLNHKPFTIKITISSIVAQNGLLKIFLGPKIQPGELINKKNLFVLLDQFDAKLKIGSNIITRTSYDMAQFAEDFTSLNIMRKQSQNADYELNSLPYKSVKSQAGYPARLMLPKGLAEGLPIQMFVILAPYYEVDIGEFYSKTNNDANMAILSPGYPFDLRVEDLLLLELPNTFLKDIMVVHKSDYKPVNYKESKFTNKTYSEDKYNASSEPNNFAYRKEPFDYMSKKAQYEKTDNNLLTHAEHITFQPEVGNIYNETDKLPFELPSKSNWISKTNKPFDYISKVEHYKNKDISEQNEEVDVIKDLPQLDIASKQVNDDDLEERKVIDIDQILMNAYTLPESKTDDHVKHIAHDIEFIPFLTVTVPKKRYTVYDYIFNRLDETSLSDEKVYER